MRPQVNLANPVLLPPKPFFQFNNMLMALGVLLLGLVFISLYIETAVGRFTREAAGQKGRLTQQQKQLELQQAGLPQRKSNPEVAARLASLQSQEELMQRIGEALEGNRDLLRARSDYLVALASRPLKGVWLTGVRITDGGVTLTGQSMQASAIPASIGQIESMAPFKGLSFSAFEVSHATLPSADIAKGLDVLEFTLSGADRREVGK